MAWREREKEGERKEKGQEMAMAQVPFEVASPLLSLNSQDMLDLECGGSMHSFRWSNEGLIQLRSACAEVLWRRCFWRTILSDRPKRRKSREI